VLSQDDLCARAPLLFAPPHCRQTRCSLAQQLRVNHLRPLSRSGARLLRCPLLSHGRILFNSDRCAIFPVS
jgi:hypothetical protein